MYGLSVRNPFEPSSMIYEGQNQCLSELVRRANRAINEQLDDGQLTELKAFKKIRKNSKNVDDVLNITSISKLLNHPKKCSLFYRMLVQCSTSQPQQQLRG